MQNCLSKKQIFLDISQIRIETHYFFVNNELFDVNILRKNLITSRAWWSNHFFIFTRELFCARWLCKNISNHDWCIALQIHRTCYIKKQATNKMSIISFDLICKKLKRSNYERILTEEFDHEINILFVFCCLQDSNIIFFIIVFSKDTIYNFFFSIMNEK
jgi:hypothetical protein